MTYSGNSRFLLFPATVVGRGVWLWSFLLMLPWAGVAQCITLSDSPASGDLQVSLSADKSTVRAISSAGDANLITYTIRISNTSEAPLEHIDFEGQLFNGNDVALDANFFQDYHITTEHFPPASFRLEQNPLRVTGDLSLGPQESGELKVQVRLDDIPDRNILKGQVSVSASGVVDSDLNNNWATVESVVQTEGKDIMITKTANSTCLNENSQEGNIITLSVVNTGSVAVDFSEESITVVDLLKKAEGDIIPIRPHGWTEDIKGNSGKINFKRSSGVLLPGETISVSYRVIYESNYEYDNAATVTELAGESDKTNNKSKNVKFVPKAGEPEVESQVLFYLQGEKSKYLSVTGADEFGEYNWYYKRDGSSFPGIKPSTAEPGTTSYYVSQSNNGCESELAEVKVTVVGPETGSLGGNGVACRNMTYKLEGSDEEVEDYLDKGYTYTYEWEFQLPKEESGEVETIEEDLVAWEPIDGEIGDSYSSSSIKDGTKFRRYTIVTRNADRKCVRSAPTDPITVSVKPCAVTTNPMMPSRATSPQEP